MKKVKAAGGWGNEAIENCYFDINRDDRVDQVIIIGDAPGHTHAETNLRRTTSNGETYWQSRGFPLVYADSELLLLKNKRVPIHSFYIPKSKACLYFNQVSSETGGLSQPFNVDAADASSMLAEFIASRIL
jgi:hypothetical protein